MERKIVIIGAGSAVFTQGLVADMILVGDDGDLHLVDIDPENLSVAKNVVRRMIDAKEAPIRLTATTDRRESLPDADVVVSTFGVGGRRAWERDVFIPRQHGIFQPVGDSVMPGGISRAMRQIPIAIGIARDVEELCPRALVINYANPMTAIVRAMRKVSDVNVLGLCHGVIHVQGYLAELAGVPLDGLSLTAIGVNHCTWITDVVCQGSSLWPVIERALEMNPPEMPDPADPFAGTAPFSWELYDAHGAFPAVLDRHVTEFYPAMCREKAYYGRTLGVDAYTFEGTIQAGDETFAEMAEISSGARPLDPEVFDHAPGEHEQLVTILACLAGDDSGVFSVNLPNSGRVRSVPDEAILEGMAYIDGGGVRTLDAGRLSPALQDQISHRATVAELVVDAALSGDIDDMALAIHAEGAVTRPHQARALARELVQAQIEHLPQFQ
jgi:alpha-galactosidase